MECSNPNTSFTKIRIIKNLAVISVSFLLIFTAYDGLSMLQTTMNKEEGVGTVAQTVLHISYGLSSLLLSSLVVMKLGTKNSQFLGVVMYLPYVAANFYASWVTLIPSAVIQGMGSTFLWAAQCTYFNECSTLYKELTDASTNFISRPKITYISDKEIVEELSALDLMNKTEGGQNPQRNCEKSLEISSTVCLSPGRYVRDNVPKNQPETNQRWSEKNKEHDEGFVQSNSKWNPFFKSSATIQSIEIKENNSFEIHTTKNVQNTHNKTSRTFSSTNALFFGLHGLAYCSAQVWSNLISFYVLSSGQVENYNKTSDCSCGVDFCSNDEECVNTKIEEVPADVRYFYTGLCLVCGIAAVLLIWLFVDPMVRSRGQVNLSWNHIFATTKFMKNKQQIFIIPLTICACMLQAFYTADFTKSFIACSWSTSHVGLVTVFYGVASALSSIISGLLIRLFGRRIVLIFAQIINIVSLVLLYLWTPDADQSFMLCMAGGIFGFIVGILHSQTKALYGVFFQGHEETAFPSCNTFSAIGWALPFVYSEFFCTSVKLYVLFTIACLGLIGYLFAERSFSQRRHENVIT